MNLKQPASLGNAGPECSELTGGGLLDGVPGQHGQRGFERRHLNRLNLIGKVHGKVTGRHLINDTVSR